MQSSYNLYLHELKWQNLLSAIAICAFLNDFQGLGDKENMYGVGVGFTIYKLREWMVQSFAYIHKKVICKRILI